MKQTNLNEYIRNNRPSHDLVVARTNDVILHTETMRFVPHVPLRKYFTSKGLQYMMAEDCETEWAGQVFTYRSGIAQSFFRAKYQEVYDINPGRRAVSPSVSPAEYPQWFLESYFSEFIEYCLELEDRAQAA